MAVEEEECKLIILGKDEFAGLIGGLASSFVESQVGGGVGQILGGLLREGGNSIDRGTTSLHFSLQFPPRTFHEQFF